MDDSDQLISKKQMIAQKQMIMQALDQCSDPDILDLVYKLLTFDNMKKAEP